MSKQINYKELLNFKWPPNVESLKPKQKHKYSHHIVVISNDNPDVGYVLNFPSEKKARTAKKYMGECTNDVIIDYERKEIPVLEDGYVR